MDPVRVNWCCNRGRMGYSAGDDGAGSEYCRWNKAGRIPPRTTSPNQFQFNKKYVRIWEESGKNLGRIWKESGKNLDRVPNKLKKKKKKKKRMEKGRILNDPEVSNGAVPAMRGEAVVGW